MKPPGLSRFLAALRFDVALTDPVTYGGVAELPAAAGLVACYLPARRALRVDPKVALAVEQGTLAARPRARVADTSCLNGTAEQP